MSDQSSTYLFELPIDDDKALIANLKRRLDVGRRARPDGRAKLNVAYMLGQQWVTWDESSQRLRRAVDRKGTPNPLVRLSVNKIGEIVEGTIARMTKSSPTPGTRPASAEPSDRRGAKVGERILTHEFERLNFQSTLTEHLFWVEGVGWAYLHPYWDPDDGPAVGSLARPEEDSEEYGWFVGMLERLTRGRPENNGALELFEGNVKIDLVPHFELVVDPGARTMEEARWCIRSTMMTREDVWERWDKKVESQQDARSFNDEIREMFDATNTKKSSKVEDQVEVHQFWCKPNTRLCPKGVVFTWTGDTPLETIDPWPYEKIKRLPFVQTDFLPGMGTREGRTWVTDLIPMQKDYNDAVSRVATVRRQLGPKVLAPRGAFDQRRMTSRVEVVDYRDVGAKPEWWSPPSGWIDPHIASAEMRLQEMQSRAGQQDVSSGEAPSGMAAAAILALQEADDTKLAIPAKNLADSISELGWFVLMLCQQFWDEPRVVRTWSEDGQPEVENFAGADIEEQLDVHISSESLLQRSKSAQIALAQFLVENGLVQDPHVILRTLTLPGLDAITEYLSEDAQHQKREIDHIKKGEPVRVEYWHNHGEHLAELYSWMKTADFEQEPPEVQEMARAHAVEHENMVRGGMIPMPGTEAQSGEPDNLQTAALAMGGGSPIAPDPMAAAAGQEPSQVARAGNVGRIAGIGGPGQPGRVPGIPVEMEAGRIGQ